jgi:hypothetical protein
VIWTMVVMQHYVKLDNYSTNNLQGNCGDNPFNVQVLLALEVYWRQRDDFEKTRYRVGSC